MECWKGFTRTRCGVVCCAVSILTTSYGCSGTSRTFGSDGGGQGGLAGQPEGGGRAGIGGTVNNVGGSVGVGDAGIGTGGTKNVGDAGAGAGGENVGDAGAGGQAPSSACGNGELDAGEDCDLGAANSAAAFGPGKCTDKCKDAPFCGDSKKNGTEVCDEGGTSVDLGSCNPECSGYFDKKYIKKTFNKYPAGGLGGIAGADAKCVLEFGAGWKALLVGGGRRATTTPFLGDGAKAWVLKKYTYYYSYYADALLWRTDAVALLGVRDGKRVNVYVDAFLGGGDYPWSGWKTDWTTLPDSTTETSTCAAWTSQNAGYAAFCFPDLTFAAGESCSTGAPLLCVEQ